MWYFSFKAPGWLYSEVFDHPDPVLLLHYMSACLEAGYKITSVGKIGGSKDVR